jgi:hypothetical protein
MGERLILLVNSTKATLYCPVLCVRFIDILARPVVHSALTKSR